MIEHERETAEKMQGKIIGEIAWIRKAYPGYEPLETHLKNIENYVDVALECLNADHDTMTNGECRELMERSIIKIKEDNMSNKDKILICLGIKVAKKTGLLGVLEFIAGKTNNAIVIFIINSIKAFLDLAEQYYCQEKPIEELELE